jgi:hypothetical protein
MDILCIGLPSIFCAQVCLSYGKPDLQPHHIGSFGWWSIPRLGV